MKIKQSDLEKFLNKNSNVKRKPKKKIMKKSLKINSFKKSSRSKADLFEVLIAERIAKNIGIKKNFKKITDNLIKVLAKFENGHFRIKEQEERAEKTSKELIKFLRNEGVNQIKDVEWIGRYYRTKDTLSDVDLTLGNNEIIGVSLKSTRLGLGTQKNLGYKTLKEYLSLDLDKEIEEMWRRVRLDLKQRGGPLESLSLAPKTLIKNKKRKYPIIEKIGKKYGYPVQVKSVIQSTRNFNNLSPEKKGIFLKLIFGLEENKRRLLNIVAQKNKLTIYWNEVYDSIISGENLQAKKLRDISYGIYLKDKLILRLQASFTNGIGISPYCQRAFLPN